MTTLTRKIISLVHENLATQEPSNCIFRPTNLRQSYKTMMSSEQKKSRLHTHKVTSTYTNRMKTVKMYDNEFSPYKITTLVDPQHFFNTQFIEPLN